MPPENDDGLTQQDRDYLVRTVIGEAGNQPPEGQAAVAYSVLNRLKAGGYGDTPTQVVLAPSQYEPWGSRSRELMAIPTNSNIYNDAGKIVDGVFSGAIPDPTNGATHFFAPAAQAALGRQPPSWAQGQGLTIGGHTFFKPNDRGAAVASQQAPDYLSEFLGSKQQPEASSDASTPASASQTDYLSEFAKAKASQPASAPAASTINPAAENGIGPPVPSDPPEGYYDNRQHINLRPPPQANEFMERTVKPIMNLPAGIATVGKDYLSRLAELGNQSGATLSEGMEDIGKNNALSGAGKVLLGLAGYPAAVTQAIDAPLTKMTGNPDFAEKAAMIGPGVLGGAAVNAVRPTVSALSDIVKDVGIENIPQVLQRLQSNPKLTLMDVAPTVQGNAAGLANDTRNGPAMTHLNDFQNERMAGRPADTVNIFEDALGPTPNMADTVNGLKQSIKDVGKNVIDPALEGAQPIPVKSLTSSIDRMIGSPEAIAGETPRIPLDPTQLRLLKLRNEITSGEAAPLNERVGLAIGPVNDALKSGTLGDGRSADFTEARRLLNSARRGNTSEEDLISGLKALAKKQKIVGPIDDAVKMITKGPTEYRSADFVHDVQSRLREEASNLSSSASGAERNMAHYLYNAREKLIDQIDKAAGGKYRPGLKQYASANDVDRGFREGFSVFSNPSSAEAMIANHPDMWERWMESASDVEKKAVAQGILFGANNRALNMRKAVDVQNDSYAHQRIASVIGKGNADEIVRRLQDWRDVAETDNLLTKNSKTFLLQAAQKARGVRESKSGKDVLQSLVPAAMVGGMAHMASGSSLLSAAATGTAIAGGKLANIAGRMHDVSSNTAYAKWASATGQKKQDLINILRDAAAKSNPASRTQKLMNLIPAPVLQALPR